MPSIPESPGLPGGGAKAIGGGAESGVFISDVGLKGTCVEDMYRV